MGRFAEFQGPGAVWGDGDGATSAKVDSLFHHFFNESMLELLSNHNAMLTGFRRLWSSALASLGIFSDAANECPGGGASE